MWPGYTAATQGKFKVGNMSKGAFGIPDTMLAVIFGVIGVFILGMMLVSQVGEFSARLDTNILDLQAIDSAHLIENCLGGGWKYIRYADMEKYARERISISEKCGIGVQYLKITDLESGISWEFGEKTGERKYDIFINIISGDEIHMGRLEIGEPFAEA